MEPLQSLRIFDELVDQAIPKLMEALGKLDCINTSLFSFSMPEKNANVESVQVTDLSALTFAEQFISLHDALKPHYRSEDYPFPRRLVGYIQLFGEDELVKAAKSAATRVNLLKNQFGVSLKQDFPKMHERTRFIRKQFKTLSTRSVHRLLIIEDESVRKISLSWSDKNKKAPFVSLDDVKKILMVHYPMSPGIQAQKLKMVEARMSHHQRDRLIHFTDVRVHVVQYITRSSTPRIRKGYRPGLPVLIFGQQTLPPCQLNDFAIDMPKSHQNDTHRYTYSPILPEIGLFQRRLTEQEWREKEIKNAR